MRVLLTSYYPLPDSGGISTYVSWLKDGLQRRGHHVDVLSPHPSRRAYYIHGQRAMVDKGPIKHFAYHAMKKSGHRVVGSGNRFVESMELERHCLQLAAGHYDLASYDVIHAQDVVSSIAMHRVRPDTAALVTTIHGLLSREMSLSRELAVTTSEGILHPSVHEYLISLQGQCVSSSEVVTANSEWLKRAILRECQSRATNVHVVPAGIHVKEFDQRMSVALEEGGRSKNPIVRDGINIICPARLTPVKGHSVLLRALVQLRNLRTDWCCFMVGEGPLREGLGRQVSDLGLTDHVVFLGRRDDVPALLSEADIFVLASIVENQPFAVMEAQLAGIPVVCTDAGGVAEMVRHGETGLLSPVGDSHALFSNLRTVLESKSIRTELGTAARRFGAREWDLERMIDRMSLVYATAITANSDTPRP